jgi:hypothetical protein
MKYEKPQSGNPHELPVKQHVFPAASIARFTQGDGCVSVYLIKHKKEILVKPDDQIFCARWVWDYRAEIGFMKQIEDKNQTKQLLLICMLYGIFVLIEGHNQLLIKKLKMYLM